MNECNKQQSIMQKRRKFIVFHLLLQNVLPGINLRRIIPYIKNKKRRTEVSIYPLETEIQLHSEYEQSAMQVLSLLTQELIKPCNSSIHR
jgi:hypothetical protein